MTTHDKALEVRIAGVPTGRVSQLDDGRCVFEYRNGYEGLPLSLSMPVSNALYGDKVVRPYLFGLLPDDSAVRRMIASEFDVSENNPFALLGCVGLDCPGAVQFIQGDLDDSLPLEGAYRSMSEVEIGARLERASLANRVSWQAVREHWSLGGQQAKIALAKIGGEWFSCEGAAATTHILKPGIAELSHQALNEFACMRLAAACGIPAAKVEYKVFDGQPAIVVERFDRFFDDDGNVLRIHQEDLCQSLSVFPEKKYASDGGPSVRDVAKLLEATDNALQNKLAFTVQLFFNYLVGAPDAHAKNYSVMFDELRGALLAPLYDVASGLAYEPPRGGWRLAMSIGGENRIGRVRANEIKRYAEICRLDELVCLNAMGNLAEAILAHVDAVFRLVRGMPGGRDLASRLQPAIKENCERTLRAL